MQIDVNNGVGHSYTYDMDVARQEINDLLDIKENIFVNESLSEDTLISCLMWLNKLHNIIYIQPSSSKSLFWWLPSSIQISGLVPIIILYST